MGGEVKVGWRGEGGQVEVAGKQRAATLPTHFHLFFPAKIKNILLLQVHFLSTSFTLTLSYFKKPHTHHMIINEVGYPVL